MVATGQNADLVQIRFKNALSCISMRLRTEQLIRMFNECSLKELQSVYLQLIESIFGISAGQMGWNTKRISRYDRPDDFEVLLRFLHPQGPLFEIAYKLLGDVYLKYEYNIAYLPASFRQLIEEGNVPAFYLEKCNVDPLTKQPLSLHLNSFELYMFHFTFHLVSPWHSKPDNIVPGSHETVYLHLSDLYQAHFLPIETSVVLPTVLMHHPTPRSPPPQVNPIRISTIFKKSVLNNILAASTTQVVSQPHAEIWRSETFVHIIIYMWLNVPEQIRSREPNKQMSPQSSPFNRGPRLAASAYSNTHYQDTRAAGDHLRVVRNMTKHMHYFANNIRNDGTVMDEMRKSIRNVMQRPYYQFLRHNIHHWPLDSSFLLMLETYLSYIQPWRYQRYNAAVQTGQSTSVDNQWAPFIMDNILVYTSIITELISRFSRMDLSTPRNAHMLYRLAKVMYEPDLPNILYQTDELMQGRADDGYVALFTRETEKHVVELLRTMKATSALVAAEETASQQQTSSLFQSVLDWFKSSIGEEYSSSDRQATIAYLDHAVKWLSGVFCVDVPEVPCEPGSPAAPFQPNLLDPQLAIKRAALIKYMGNPDTQPIRSTEIAPLVRFLHRISMSINQIHGPQLAELWYRDDFWGKVSRQLLGPPCHTHHFHKTGPGNPAPLITTMLPPRVCLRPLAKQSLVIFIFFLFIFPHVFGYSPPIVYLTCAIIYILIVIGKAMTASYFEKESDNNLQDPFLQLDISFNE